MIQWPTSISLLFSWVLVSASLVGTAHAWQYTATYDRQQIRIGEQIQLTLTARVDESQLVDWPNIQDTLVKYIEVVERTPIDTVKEPENIPEEALLNGQDQYFGKKPTWREYSQTLYLTSFDTGFYAIPPFRFEVDGEIHETEPALIEVQPFVFDSTAVLADIKGPLAENYTFWNWLSDNYWWLFCILLLAAVSYYAWMQWKKRVANRPVHIVRAPPKPPHEIALARLYELEEKKLWQNNHTKAYHSELSEILRGYIEGRFGLLALEQTTEEITTGLRSLAIDEGQKQKVRQVLQLSDLAKFAKAKPLPNENELSLENAKQFVLATKPMEESINPVMKRDSTAENEPGVQTPQDENSTAHRQNQTSNKENQQSKDTN